MRSSLAGASLAAATRADAYLEGLLTLARSTAVDPVLLSKPRSVPAQELLRGALVARRFVVLAGVFSPAGETIVMVRRNDLKEEIGEEAIVALASRDGDMVFGSTDTLGAFPAAAVEEAMTGRLGSGWSEHSGRTPVR